MRTYGNYVTCVQNICIINDVVHCFLRPFLSVFVTSGSINFQPQFTMDQSGSLIILLKVNEENPKMSNILKTADRRSKRKNLGLAVWWILHIGYFSFVLVGSVWGHSVHCVKSLILRFPKGSHICHHKPILSPILVLFGKRSSRPSSPLWPLVFIPNF